MYTRWGRATCPNTPGTELVYAGRVGGTYYSHKGGAANYICMPNNPDYSAYTAGVQGENPVYGTEFETAFFSNIIGPLAHAHNQSQLNVTVHLPGPSSTLAISCPAFIIITVQCLSV